MRGHDERGVEIESEFFITGAGTDRRPHTFFHVEPVDVGVLGLDVDRRRIARVDLDVTTVGGAELEPVPVGNSTPMAGGARPAPAAVVLKSAIDPVGLLHVDRYPDELSDGHGMILPMVPTVVAGEEPAVAAHDQWSEFSGSIHMAWKSPWMKSLVSQDEKAQPFCCNRRPPSVDSQVRTQST